jgi:hypothetical protein
LHGPRERQSSERQDDERGNGTPGEVDEQPCASWADESAGPIGESGLETKRIPLPATRTAERTGSFIVPPRAGFEAFAWKHGHWRERGRTSGTPNGIEMSRPASPG